MKFRTVLLAAKLSLEHLWVEELLVGGVGECAVVSLHNHLLVSVAKLVQQLTPHT